jgi:hypothetical protein
MPGCVVAQDSHPNAVGSPSTRETTSAERQNVLVGRTVFAMSTSA